MTVTIRVATAADLSEAYDVQREASEAVGMAIGNVAGPADGRVPAKFRHELQHGRFLIAEVDGRMAGFGAVFQRAGVAFLATFYVRPDAQAAGLGVGQALLAALFEGLGPARCVVSSGVHRALALYARNDLLPRWPLLMLDARSDRLAMQDDAEFGVEPADVHDPDLLTWDAEIAGRGERTVDQRYWRDEYCADPYWIERAGRRVGYAYIQKLFASPDAPWNPDAVCLGPIGVRESSDAAGAVLAVAGAAGPLAERLLIDVPGAHPALPVLLDAGFRIFYQATFCSSSASDIFDPRRYTPADTITF